MPIDDRGATYSAGTTKQKIDALLEQMIGLQGRLEVPWRTGNARCRSGLGAAHWPAGTC